MNTPQNRPSFRSVGEGDFESAVLHSSKPVLVLFCAPWSKPCQVISTVLAEMATTCAGRVEVLKVAHGPQCAVLASATHWRLLSIQPVAPATGCTSVRFPAGFNPEKRVLKYTTHL